MRYNIDMSKKQSTILDELTAGIGGLLLVVSFFIGYFFVSMLANGVTEQKWNNLQSLLPPFMVLSITLAICLILKGQRKKKIQIAKAISEKEAHLSERANKYRQFYNLSEDLQLYYDGDILSTYPTSSTTHERIIAEQLLKSEAFSPNCIFLDSYFKTNTGKTVQIDIIAVSRRGIFVVESKDYSGWIFGNGGQTRWTQTIYREKFRFYNPIKQNVSHINALKNIVGNDSKCYSLVVFGDGATIKDVSYIPKGTYVLSSRRLHEVLSDIWSETDPIYSAEDVLRICRKIQKSRLTPDENLRASHIEEIKDQTGEKRLYS